MLFLQAKEGLDFCGKLYGIEKELVDVSPEKRYEERLLRSQPVLEAFLVWLNDTKEISLPQSHLGKAIDY